MSIIRASGFCLTILSFSLILSPAKGQVKDSNSHSIDSISLGISYADTGAYTKAGALFEAVSPTDTNYKLALLEDAIAKDLSNQDSLATIICRKGISLKSQYTPDFYNLLASAYYIDNNNYADAIKLLKDTALSQYPGVRKLYFTLGLAQYKMHNFSDAIISFEKSIDMDNYDALSHYYLGVCCLEQGRLVPALLSLQFYLVLQPQSPRSYSAVALIEQMTENSYPYNKLYQVSPSAYHDSAFMELDLIVRSKIATNKGYKATTKLTYDVAKQLQLFMEELKYIPNTGNYWMEKYVPFFTRMQQKQYLEPYLCFILSSTNDITISKDIVKNKKNIREFAQWADKILLEDKSNTKGNVQQ